VDGFDLAGSRKIPSTKFQKNLKSQIPKLFEIWDLEFFWCLEFGAWDLI